MCVVTCFMTACGGGLTDPKDKSSPSSLSSSNPSSLSASIAPSSERSFSSSLLPSTSSSASSRASSDGASATMSSSSAVPADVVFWKKNETQWLYTSGNKIYYADGTVFRGRGANIHDTRSCNACAYSSPNVAEVKRRIDELVEVWGANFMRLNLESYKSADGRVHWQSFMTDQAYLQDIVEIIEYIGTKPGVYALVSLWAEPTTDNLGGPTDATVEAWKVLAPALIDQPHVMFGVINEPHTGMNDASNDANVWQGMNDVVAAAREIEAENNSDKHIITVQGTRGYARYLGYYLNHPITAGGGENIAYETHAYLNASDFEAIWINPSATLPVIIGEFGPADIGGGQEMDMEEVRLLMDEAEKRDISWLAWTFHMRCNPSLLVDSSNNSCGIGMDLVPSEWGLVVKDRLAAAWHQGDTSAISSISSSSVGNFESAVGIVYDGESSPFSAASSWDSNGSTLVDSTASPYSGTHHLRATLNVTNWWGGVAYVYANWTPRDWTEGVSLSFRAKSNTPTALTVLLYDVNENQSANGSTIMLGTDYVEYTIALSTLAEGVSLNVINAIVFADSASSSGNFTIDIDDIVIHGN